jgi:hypothetical protein
MAKVNKIVGFPGILAFWLYGAYVGILAVWCKKDRFSDIPALWHWGLLGCSVGYIS